MRKTDTYLNNLEYIEERTEKVMLNKTDVGKLLKISRPTVESRFGEHFKDGYITVATLATILSQKG